MNPVWFTMVVCLVVGTAVSTVKATCPFSPKCQSCYISTKGETRDMDLWTFQCIRQQIYCNDICSALSALNASVELLDLRFSYIYDCHSVYGVCNITAYEVDMSYVNDIFLGEYIPVLLNMLKHELRTLKLRNTRHYYLPYLDFSIFPSIKEVDFTSSNIMYNLQRGRATLNGANSIERIYLDCTGITEVPAQIRSLKSLKFLSLRGNNLNKTTLDKYQDYPITLESLDLSHNKLSPTCCPVGYPMMLTKLVNLRDLRMHNTTLRSYNIPTGFFENMTRLETLDLSASFSSSVLHTIKIIQRLKVFNHSSNKERWLPPLVKASVHLQQLYFRNNIIEHVTPYAFGNNRNLSVVDLGENKIRLLPSLVFYGVEQSLTHLYLDVNQLRTLDKCTILRLERLRLLRIGLNPFHCDCGIAWLRTYRSLGVDVDLERAFCHSPLRFRGMGVAVFPTDECAMEQFGVDITECFEEIYKTARNGSSFEQYNIRNDSSSEPTDGTVVSLQYVFGVDTRANTAIGLSVTCLLLIGVFAAVNALRFYRRHWVGRGNAKAQDGDRPAAEIQGSTSSTAAGEIGPYQELEAVNRYQNVGFRTQMDEYESQYQVLGSHATT